MGELNIRTFYTWFLTFCLILGTLQLVSPMSFRFNCPYTQPSFVRPTSVHRLRPVDIEVVGALGDSITAGFAMKSNSIINVFFEWRGLSFSVGGDGSLDSGICTIPNILKKFNSNIYGYSQKAALLGFPPVEKMFNAAVTGAEARDALGQAKDLVWRMKSRMGSSYGLQWKLITVYIGQNDQCDHCSFNGSMDEFVKNYEEEMMEGLDYLYYNLPRALVQIIGMVNPTKFFNQPATANNPVCKAIHGLTCDCIADWKNIEKSNEAHRKMNTALRSLAASGRYDTKDDFTLVYQPFLEAADLPKKPNSDEYDLTYMGHDCFHPGARLHSIFGAELWNSMLTPVTQKIPLPIEPKEEFVIKCPTAERPYIATNRN